MRLARCALLFAVASAVPALLSGQALSVTGTVVRGADSLPVPNQPVVLHAVPRTGGGAPVDSAVTDAAGRYRLRHGAVDTNAVYLVSTTFRDITYFSEGILPDGPRQAAVPLVVYDTSATAPPIGVAQRHVVVRTPDADGSRRVLELLVLANDGDRTRVARDSLEPVWMGRLPAGAVGFEPGESDVSAEAVRARGDTIRVVAPIPPGEKQLLYTYLLPAGRDELLLRADQAHARLTILLEDTAAVPVEGALTPRGIQVFEDAQFAMYEATGVPAGSSVRFRFVRRAVSGKVVQALVVGLAALALAVTLLVWWRRRGGADDPEALARAIAALDGALEARSGASPAERAAYQGRRARLKARLEAALARRASGP